MGHRQYKTCTTMSRYWFSKYSAYSTSNVIAAARQGGAEVERVLGFVSPVAEQHKVEERFERVWRGVKERGVATAH